MATSRDAMAALRRSRRRAGSWLRRDRYATVKLVTAITVFGLALRLVALGERVAHFDEGRVAYWALHYRDSGSFAYRYIIHGPFIQHVDSWVFAVVGPSDFAMRLPVAIIGGLLPLSALLFRRHLRQTEVVAFALLLAVNPVLLYYSRFMRSDILVAAFMFTAFGMLVRFADTRSPRYLYATTALMALGFASKENALVYVVTWLGATGLLVAKRLFLPGGFKDAGRFLLEVSSTDEVRARVVGWAKGRFAVVVGTIRAFRGRHDSALRVLGVYALHIVLASLLFLLVSLFFYAPRGGGVPGIEYPPVPPSAGTVGFWEGITNPSLFGELLRVTVDRIADQWVEWLPFDSGNGGGGVTEEGSILGIKSIADYEDHFGVFIKALGYGSAPLALFAGLGYVLDRWGYTTPRHLVPFLFYCGFVSIFGYPLGTDIGAPWIVTHAVVPLALPAAVALAAVFDWGIEALAADDTIGVAISGLVFLLIATLVVYTAGTMVYANTTADSNEFVQYAQPDQSIKEELREMDRVAAANNGTDTIVYHGESGDDYDEADAYVKQDRDKWNESWWNTRPTCLEWHNTLPLPWYLAAGEMDVDCENQPAALGETISDDGPPIVITQQYDSTVPQDRLEAAGYEGSTHLMRTHGDQNLVTIWIHESARN